jgi:uncharacterized membrane protein YebE (DUF533 family)
MIVSDMNQPSVESQNEEAKSTQESATSHPLATGLGAIGGGAAGAALGKSISGKVGAALGGVAGAIAGGLVGNAIANFSEEAIEEIQPSLGLGANNKPIELPRHYTWEALQALSKPQSNNSSNSS